MRKRFENKKGPIFVNGQPIIEAFLLLNCKERVKMQFINSTFMNAYEVFSFSILGKCR